VQVTGALHGCGHPVDGQAPASTVADARATSAAVPIAIVASLPIAPDTARLRAFWSGLATRSLLPGPVGSAVPLRI
jgi:hypothetical protein